ncbi:glycosyltransferase [Nitrogeniibacter mangrovi]|uniref:Glycosyltransferase n=1 Tax=Nitrogeniibacter mangrovi TaxID=2016596 RepID=A0A6C1B3M6_9RHOO|nr:TIGR04282 family arsenosugar biosynthesis glycosyltransferase [Nitrogeniibacter mangrovi]QID18262.1 glycosyltransferase [Nitrogeniibacter mangrovi]
MSRPQVAIAVFAKAPVAGQAKTRLIPALGAARAARLHQALLERTVHTACAAGLGPVTLWCAPDTDHPVFTALARRHPIGRQAQVGADLGERMHHAFARHDAAGPMLLIGTDCPALATADLQAAATRLCAGEDAVFTPAEDGGYVLVGLHRPEKRVFDNVRWGGAQVMARTRDNLRAAALRWTELPMRWDVDRPVDLARLNTLRPALTDW